MFNKIIKNSFRRVICFKNKIRFYKFAMEPIKNPETQTPVQPEGEKKMSKNALKKLKKQQEKERKKLEKLKKMQEQELANPKPKKKTKMEDLNPREYYKNRVKIVQELKKDKQYFPYPHKFHTTHRIKELKPEFEALCKEANKFTENSISVAGRVYSIRASGKYLIFMDLYADSEKIQILGNKNFYENKEEFERLKDTIKRGDIIGVTGLIGRSKTGELSIQPTFLQLLSPCLHMLPKSTKNNSMALTDHETRYRQRYLDLMVNKGTREIFITRSKIVSYLRHLLGERDFLEVETPILNMKVGGASAKPFYTKHNSLNLDMCMRVAPELFLKNCVVGGLNRVFEIGKNFRNEGIDPTHNPEFTSCELYWAFADYKDLIKMTEEIICQIVLKIKGTYKFEIQKGDKKVEIDFSPPWKQISVISELEKILKTEFPTNFTTDSAKKYLDNLCSENKVECTAPRTQARLLDSLIAHYLEPQCINPTFIMEQPQIMCPLAKYHRSKKGLSERFEVFINEKEYINAYTELNDPFVQLEQFELQQEAKNLGDEEANDVDHHFVKCLEHGLPPTAGWGLGVDRLCMLLTDKQNIQEVILFPAMKPVEKEGGEKEGGEKEGEEDKKE